ncbi:MAG TPA: enoyl-CoA hydratase/isomerase family protein [Mycobacteriales bacterium]|nr:enoyl-CoA hydratase/isomerase family protein [Mycobacteriales bacterium]
MSDSEVSLAAEHISYAVRDGVAHITLSRPEKRNALAAATRAELLTAFAAAGRDPAVGAVLLAGEGPDFCAGGDLTGAPKRETLADHRAFLVEVDAFHAAVRDCPVPVIAAVHGNVLGAGLLLAASCDLVVAADTAVLGLPEGRIGLVGGTGLVAAVGRQWAKMLQLSGELISADRAAQIGLVLTCVPAADLRSRTTELAERLARMPREATTLNKRAIDAVADAADDPARRQAAIEHDAVTLDTAKRALAPDGRAFADIIATEGMRGLKAAREQQWTEPWLPGAPGE